jgi:hypothetical protein
MFTFAPTANAGRAGEVIHAALRHCRYAAIFAGVRRQKCLKSLFSSQLGPFEQPFELPVSRM